MKRCLFILALLSLQACHSSNTKQNEVSKQPLAENDLYNPTQVTAFLKEHSAQNPMANEYFMKAIDAYRNKKNQLPEAIGLFKQSILLRPSAKAYYEMGNACLDNNNLREAIAAYHMGEQLGFEPLSKLLYNTACAYSRLKQKDSAVVFLEYAIEAGYANADQIMKDPDLVFARTAENFQQVYQTAMGGSSDPETVAWFSFKRGFIIASFPLVLNKETPIDAEHSISYDFEKFVPEMKGERFSREVGKEFYYLAKVDDNPAYTSLVYAVKNTMMGEAAPVAFVLVSFSSKGRLIDKMIAGGQLEPGQMYKVGSLQRSGQFEVKEYEQVYEQDPAEHGYEANKLLSSDLKNTRRYHVTQDGHFVEDNHMVGMK